MLSHQLIKGLKSWENKKEGFKEMRIMPIDIQQRQFSMRFRGFDPDEVYQFLEIIRQELEDLLRENASLKDQVSRLEAQVKDYGTIESSLKETLVATQQMAEQYKANAHLESELIIREAKLNAENIIKEYQEKTIKLHEDITDLKGIRSHFKEEIRRLIESHIRMLEFDTERESKENHETICP